MFLNEAKERRRRRPTDLPKSIHGPSGQKTQEEKKAAGQRAIGERIAGCRGSLFVFDACFGVSTPRGKLSKDTF